MRTVIATTTFSKKLCLRARLALETTKKAAQLGLPIVVVDGGSCQELRVGIIEQGAMLVDEKEHGMGPSRRQAIREAAGVAGPDGTVLWMEPEKWTLISQVFHLEHEMENYAFAEDAPSSARADIVVPKRRSMASYPPIQQAAELLGNMYFAKATGHALDVWVGPRLIGPRALPYFLDYKGEYGDKWDSIFIPIVRAIADGLKVVGCEVGYVHSPGQTAEEEKDPDMDLKRLGQLQSLVPSFYAEARKLGLLKKQ